MPPAARLRVGPLVVAHVAERVDADQRADDPDDQDHDHRQPVEAEEPAGVGGRHATGDLEPDRDRELRGREDRRQPAAVLEADQDHEERDGCLGGHDRDPGLEAAGKPEEDGRAVPERDRRGDGRQRRSGAPAPTTSALRAVPRVTNASRTPTSSGKTTRNATRLLKRRLAQSGS